MNTTYVVVQEPNRDDDFPCTGDVFGPYTSEQDAKDAAHLLGTLSDRESKFDIRALSDVSTWLAEELGYDKGFQKCIELAERIHAERMANE